MLACSFTIYPRCIRIEFSIKSSVAEQKEKRKKAIARALGQLPNKLILVANVKKVSSVSQTSPRIYTYLMFLCRTSILAMSLGYSRVQFICTTIFFFNSEDKKFIDKEKGLQEGKRKQTSQRKDNIPAATIICHILEST